MYQVVSLESFEQAISCLFDDAYDERIDRIRSPYAFRGMNNSSYGLQTSFFRNCFPKLHLEESLLRNFSKYAVAVEPSLTTSIWRQMIIGQHHGLPTRLLDWTYSPLVAMHFATDDAALLKLDTNDAVIWKVHIGEMNSLMPAKYNRKRTESGAYILSVDLLNDVASDLATYDSDMSQKAFAFMEPPSIDSRIVNQYALFSVVPKDIEDLADFFDKYGSKTVKYILKKELKWRVRDMLDQMNMNERILYPGLDGLARWLKRHYYVKS